MVEDQIAEKRRRMVQDQVANKDQRVCWNKMVERERRVLQVRRMGLLSAVVWFWEMEGPEKERVVVEMGYTYGQ